MSDHDGVEQVITMAWRAQSVSTATGTRAKYDRASFNVHDGMDAASQHRAPIGVEMQTARCQIARVAPRNRGLLRYVRQEEWAEKAPFFVRSKTVERDQKIPG